MTLPSSLSVAFLDRLEREEQRLLCWGYTEGAFDPGELETHARATIDATNTPSGGTVRPGDLIRELLELRWLFRIPNERAYRTRSAETIRLLSSLRQVRVFPNTPAPSIPELWRSAPPLVADYRFLAPPRSFPRRDISAPAAAGALGLERAGLEWEIFRAFVGAGTPQERKLSGFQVRATERIHAESRDAGTVVCAGTGSGKTLAFYLPAFMRLAPLVDASTWTKCLAIYPRNELLKDQLREAVSNILRVAPVLRQRGRRSLSVGVLFSDVRRDAIDVASPKWGWAPRTFDGVKGRVCPFLSCPYPDCGAALFWADEDRLHQPKPVERLRCSRPNCGQRLEGDVVRLTRQSMCTAPPDILFVSTEMLNRCLSAREYRLLFGGGRPEERRPRLMLLDEVHMCEGATGAHIAMLLRRWRYFTKARPHIVGLSATLEDAAQFFSELTGQQRSAVVEIAPHPNELEAEGADYQLAIRGSANGDTSLLSTTIQTLMLVRRVLDPRAKKDPLTGKRVFAFTDRLDTVNRLRANLRDAEGRYPDSNRLNPRGTVLAGLRRPDAPHHLERYAAGQSWDLVTTLGHQLELRASPANSLEVSRTSGQDSGVDANADVVVATASLEVGYDDPNVGAVVQHKAPLSDARFLQRKGRAGRLRAMRPDGTMVSMRPWTVVVLSDFGRDRIVYQDYERLFAPTLRRPHLPIRSRTLLRMQATYSLFDFLGVRAANAGHAPFPWKDLAAPAPDAPWATNLRALQAFYAQELHQLLTQSERQDALARFVEGSLAVSPEEAQALLWEPPRSVMLEAVPTLLRRLERRWKRAFDDSSEPMLSDGPPLPEFVQRSLFQPLLVPEVAVLRPVAVPGDASPEPKMEVLAEALRGFAPGHVSKRYDLDGDESHWIAPGNDEQLSIDAFSTSDDRTPVGRFAYREGSELREVDTYRPFRLRVSSPPNDIAPTSSARPCWRTQLLAPVKGYPIELPEGSALAPMVPTLTFHTHHLGNPVEVRRFTIGSDFALSRSGGRRDPERRVRYVDPKGAPAAIGWASEVDAISITPFLPTDFLERVRRAPDLIRSLRPLRFRALVRSAPELDGIANTFQRDALADAFATALILAANKGSAAVAALGGALQPADVGNCVMLAYGVAEGQDGDDLPRRAEELRELIYNPVVFGVLRRSGTVLWDDVDATWVPWLSNVFRATLGATLREAVMALCPDVGEDDLLVEGDGVDKNDAVVWLTESKVGGAGAVEAFYAAYAKDPRHFVRLWHAALGESDGERVASSIEQALSHVAVHGPADALVAAFAGVRGAQNHQDSIGAVQKLREAMSAAGVHVDQTVLTTLFARVLRPGSSRALDEYLEATLGAWQRLETRSGLFVDTRTFALVRADDGGLEGLLPTAPQSNDPRVVRDWTFATLLGLLWRRGGSFRREALRLGNPFVDGTVCDRLIVPLPSDVSPLVRVDSEGWFEELSTALNRHGVARLCARDGGTTSLAEALRHVAVHPIDTGALHVYARLSGCVRTVDGITLAVELPEALQ